MGATFGVNVIIALDVVMYCYLMSDDSLGSEIE